MVARLFARQEFERLLYASYYKMVFMEQQKRPADEKNLQKLLAAGFDNEGDDLNTEFYLVRADRSMPEMALLKSMYTKEQRQQLSTYLHRIEYGVETEKNCREFWAFYRDTGLFADYTAAFIKQAVFHPARFYRRLMAETTAEQAEIGLLIQGAMQNATTEEEAQYLQELLQEWQGMQNA